MKTCSRPSFLCFLVLMTVFANSSKALFFQYPKRALMNFLESLGGHKEMKPIHHYHMHYYPVPVILPKPAPPPKIEIDLSTIHSSHDQLRSLSWASHQDYGKIHDPEFAIPPPHAEIPWASPLPEAWPDSFQQKSWGWDNNEIVEKDHALKEAKPQGILLQVPLHQQIVLYQPPAKDTKSSLLTILLKKLRRINDALFHPEEDPVQQPDNKPHITNSLTYSAAS